MENTTKGADTNIDNVTANTATITTCALDEKNGRASDDKDKVVAPALWGSCRLTLAIFCFFAVFHIMFLRFGFTMALICMVGPTAHQGGGGGGGVDQGVGHLVQYENSSMEMEHEVGEFHHWDKNTQAQLLSAYFYGYIATQVAGGWLSEKFGGKLFLLIGMLANGLLHLSIPMLARTGYLYYVWGVRVAQGFVTGLAFPTIYNLFTMWTSLQEKNTLMNLAFGGSHVALFANFPVTAVLCASGVDGGWPMAYYVPGLTTLLWCFLFFHFTSSSPEDHPRISGTEQQYLRHKSCRNQSVAKGQATADRQIKAPPFPFIKVFTSVPFLALTLQHLAAGWGFYSMAINIPLFVNEVIKLDIVSNGIVSGTAYIGVFLMSFIGKVFDWIISKEHFTVNTLRKMFNTTGQLVPAALLLSMSYFGPLTQLCLLYVAVAMQQLTFSAGFYLSHIDLGGPFAGILFGITNTVAQLSAIFNPLVTVYLAPNGTKAEWQNVFYFGAAMYISGALIYLLFGSSELQEWAKTKEDTGKEKDKGRKAVNV